MPPLETLLLFFGSSVLLALAPGPDLFYVVAQSASRGRHAGAWVALGLCSGLVGHTAVVALGIGQWLAHSPSALTTIRIVGALYLVTLAWLAFRAGSSKGQASSVPQLGAGALYRRGVLMNLSNPKVTLFFLAFLPQFVEPARGAVAQQIVVLGVVFACAAMLVFQLAAFFSSSMSSSLLRTPRLQRGLQHVTALLFAGLAIRLLVA